MAKKTKSELLVFFKSEEGLNKINTIRNGLETNSIKTFPQIFATIAKSNIQAFLGNEFYAFEKKIEDPGRFTYNETEEMANLFQVKYEVMQAFIRFNQQNARKKIKRKY